MRKIILYSLAMVALLFSACKSSEGNTPTDSTMPKISRNFDELTTWFAEAVKRTHPYVTSAWNSDADIADFNLCPVVAQNGGKTHGRTAPANRTQSPRP